MLTPPTIPPWELFLACPVVQKCSSSFQGDTGRLKVKAIGTNLGFGEESSACYASICCFPQKRQGLLQAESGDLEIRTRRARDGFSTPCPWGERWPVSCPCTLGSSVSSITWDDPGVRGQLCLTPCPGKTEEEAAEGSSRGPECYPQNPCKRLGLVARTHVISALMRQVGLVGQPA